MKRSGLAMARAALRIIKNCVQFGIAWTLEHPEGSRILTWPPLHRVLMSCVCFVVLIDYCQYGMHYRKPAFVCASRREFIELGQTCRVTHLHDVLAGSFKMPDGKSCWLMSLACAYPAKLARVHARIATHLASRVDLVELDAFGDLSSTSRIGHDRIVEEAEICTKAATI